MKKLFCMILCVLLLASLAVPAFALTLVDGQITEDGVAYDFSYSGIRITYPAEFKEDGNILLAYDILPVDDAEFPVETELEIPMAE